MNNTTGVFMLFILVGGIILVLLLLTKDKGSGLLKLGRAELRIDFQNDRGWVDARRQPAGQPPVAPYLTVRGTSWRYPLPRHTILMGTGPDCQVRLPPNTADSRQAAIFWEDGRYKIRNLSQISPTQVNNRRFGTQNLGDGNTIRMGRNRLIFRDERNRRKAHHGPAG